MTEVHGRRAEWLAAAGTTALLAAGAPAAGAPAVLAATLVLLAAGWCGARSLRRRIVALLLVASFSWLVARCFPDWNPFSTAREGAAQPGRPVDIGLAERLSTAERRLEQVLRQAQAELADSTDPGRNFASLEALANTAIGGLSLYRDGRLSAWAGAVSSSSERIPGPGTQLLGRMPDWSLARVTHAGPMVLVAEQPLAVAVGVGDTELQVLAATPEDSLVLQRTDAIQPGAQILSSLENTAYAVVARRAVDFLSDDRRTSPFEDIARLLFVLALLAVVLDALRTPGLTPSRVALAIVAVAVARMLLLNTAGLRALGVFAPDALAVTAPFDLLSSPGDVLMSGVAAAAMATVLIRAIRRRHDSTVVSREPSLAWALLLLLTLATLAWVAACAGNDLFLRAARNTVLNLGDRSLWPWDGLRMAAVSGFALLVLASAATLAAPATAALRALARRLGTLGAGVVAALVWLLIALMATALDLVELDAHPGIVALAVLPLAWAVLADLPRPRSAVRFALGLLMAGVALDAASSSAVENALRDFLSNELSPRLLGRESEVRAALDATLVGLGGRRGRSLAGHQPDELAWRAWRTSPISRLGARATVDVLAPDGSNARFSHRLPLPAGIRAVSPGPPVHQEVIFEGRLRRLLAGSADLGDGTRLTFRVAMDDDAIPFLSGYLNARETLRAEPFHPLEPWSRSAVALAVTDHDGRPLQTGSTRAIGVPRRIAATASTSPERWFANTPEGRFEALSFAGSGRVFTLSWPVPGLDERLAALLHTWLLLLALTLVSTILVALFSPAVRARLPGPRWLAASYHRKVLASFVLGSTLPAIPAALYLRATVETTKMTAIGDQGLAALELARRILAESALDADPALVDDSSLIWLSENVGYELSFYRDGELVATSMRDLYREGRLPERAPAATWRKVQVEAQPSYLELSPGRNPMSLVASAAIGNHGMLSLFGVSHQSDVARAAQSHERTIFLVSAVLVFASLLVAPVIARRVTAPLLSLEHGAARIATGDLDVRIASNRTDELGTLIDTFNRMVSDLSSERLALAEKSSYLTLLLENATTGILSTDADGRIATVNPAASLLLGIPLRNAELLLARIELPHLAVLAAALRSGAPRGEVEITIPAAPGPRVLRAVFVALSEQSGREKGYLLIIEDLTGIVRSKKLEAWAEMSRRIAHEIKNPLTPVQLSTEHARRLLNDRPPGYAEAIGRCFDTILRQVHDLRCIAREFSAYGAPAVAAEPSEVEVESWLLESTRPYHDSPPTGIAVTARSPSGLHWRLDPGRMRRALINLIENAMQAMPNGGTVRVEARVNSNGGLDISVADTGPGISSEILPRLFDPYFSTRDAGTGLGLANARRIAEEHGGTIEVRETSPMGTVIVIELPPPVPVSDPARGEPRDESRR